MMRLRFALILACVAAPAGAMAPGSDLTALIDPSERATVRVGLDGAPPGPHGRVPAAPSEPGPHWLVVYDASDRIRRWIRFEVDGVPQGRRDVVLPLDTQAPEAHLVFEGATAMVDALHVLGRGATLRIEAVDDSGVARRALRAGDETLGDDGRWTPSVSAPARRIHAEVADALGNVAQRDAREVAVDHAPPTLSWRRLDAPAQLPEDVIGREGARLALDPRDDLAGVASLALGPQRWEGVALTRDIAVQVDARSLDYRIEDRVGNVREDRLALRLDTEGPVLRLAGVALAAAPPHARVARDRDLELFAEDALAGVERACVEASIWYGECRALPTTLVGLSPGRYVLRLRAVDRLGNRRSERVHIEVQP